MNYTIMAISIFPISENANKVQEVLTKYGCIIKTRLGLHDVAEDLCSQKGIMLLQILDNKNEITSLTRELTSIDGVTINSMKI